MNISLIIAVLALTGNASANLWIKHACISTNYMDAGCYMCNNYIYFTGDNLGGCQNNMIENCETMNDWGCCAKCNKTLTPVGSSCKKVTNTTCLVLDTRWDCLVCPKGNVPGAGGSCSPVTGPGVANCAYYANNTACLYCNAGYYQFQGSCYLLPPNCIKSSGLRCLQCQNGYNLTVSGNTTDGMTSNYYWFLYNQYQNMPAGSFSCTNLNVTNCSVWLNTTACSSCIADNYLAANLSCVYAAPLVANCQMYSAAGVCSQCSPGYYPSGGACIATGVDIPNCIAYNSTTTCQRCATSYYVTNAGASCTAAAIYIIYCDVYASATTCQYCFGGFYVVSSNTCVAIQSTIANCATYNSAGCVACVAPYYLSGGQCIASANVISNCVRYSANNVCEWCASNYYLSGNTCVFSSIPNCATFLSSISCQYCNMGYYPSATRDTCIATSFTTANCMYLASASTCGICNKNYYLQSTTLCLPYSIANCARFLNQTQCERCVSGYFYNTTANECQVPMPPISNCARYNSSTTCEWCANNYYLASNACVPVTNTLVLNCGVYGGNGDCMFCNTNYYSFQNQSCFRIATSVTNCMIYNTDTACYECNQNFYLSSNTCLQAYQYIDDCDNYAGAQTCQRCAYGFSLGSGGSICNPVTFINNCFQTNANSAGGCLACYSPQVPANGGGATCVDSLAVVVPNCAVASAYYNCTLCATGYYLVNPITCSTVSSTITGCVYYNSSTTCMECSNTTVLINNVCTSFDIPNCKYYASATACAVCNTGYYVANGLCTQGTTLTGCSENADATTCALCYAGFYLSGGTCVVRPVGIANCYIYSSQNTCAYCNSGYYLNALGSCILVTTTVANCNIYMTNGFCYICNTNYTLTGNGQCLANCRVAGTTNCTLCAPNYYINSNGTCSLSNQNVANCAYYANQTSCMYCVSTSVLNADGTCSATGVASNATGCRWYGAADCTLCAPNYYLSNGSCVAVTSLVSGCALYLNSTTCAVCATGHFMEEFTRACPLLPEAKPCSCITGTTWTWDSNYIGP